MANNLDALFVDPVLLQQAEQLCKQRLNKDPGNRVALRGLAEVYRKLGKLEEAAAACGLLSQFDPEDQEAGYMHALLRGREWPVAPTGIHAAPFVLLGDFLPQEFHDTLLALSVSAQAKFAPSLIANIEGTRQYKPDVRDTLDLTEDWKGRARFWNYLKEILPRVLSRLRVAPFTTDHAEMHVRAYQDGHFFKVHTDASQHQPHLANRVVSFVYFFHRVPRPYAGGDLLLFDSNPETYKMTRARFTRIVPEDNSIVVFPSSFYHCVVPERCTSKDFADSRFVVNGFVHKRAETGPAVDAPVENANGAV